MLTHGELTADCRSARFTFPYSMSNLWCRPLMAGRTEHEQTELRYQFRCSDSVIFQLPPSDRINSGFTKLTYASIY